MGPWKLRTHFQVPPAPQLFLVVKHFRADPREHLSSSHSGNQPSRSILYWFLRQKFVNNYQPCIKCYWGKFRTISPKNAILTPLPIPCTPPLLQPKKHSSRKAERRKYAQGSQIGCSPPNDGYMEKETPKPNSVVSPGVSQQNSTLFTFSITSITVVSTNTTSQWPM